MKHILPLLALSLMLSVPAMAQDGVAVPAEGAVSLPAEAPIPEASMALAMKMHEIWPIRSRIETAIDAVSKNFPPEKQAQVKATIRKSIQYDQVQEESIKAMASIFTEEELEAMVAFYGSEAGRSISAKTQDYELAMRPVIVKMLDKAMLDLKTGSAP